MRIHETLQLLRYGGLLRLSPCQGGNVNAEENWREDSHAALVHLRVLPVHAQHVFIHLAVGLEPVRAGSEEELRMSADAEITVAEVHLRSLRNDFRIPHHESTRRLVDLPAALFE